MRSQIMRFLRALAADLRDAAGEAAEPLGFVIGRMALIALVVGVFYLLGWVLAALVMDRPTTFDDHASFAVGIFGVGSVVLFVYACVRDFRRWVLRHWQAAQREAERT